MKKWRFINTNFNTAAYNMAVDEALLRSCQQGISDPVFRTYGWQPPGVSFGYTQDPLSEFNLDACRERGVDIVRRMTGGRAVYHHREVTYSVVALENEATLGGSIQQAYQVINQGLATGIAKLGVEPDFEKAKFQPDREKVKSPCFTAAARYELTYDGKKMVGSAQRKIENMLLQHGSILLAGHQLEMVTLTNFDRHRRQSLTQYLEKNTISISQILDRTVTFDELVPALKNGFAEQLKIELVEDELTPDEIKEIDRLVIEKYSQDEWNFKPRKR